MKNGKTYTLDDQTRSSDKSGYREWMGRDSVHGVGVGRYIAPDSSTGVYDEADGPVKRSHRVEKESHVLPTILREELRF